MGRTRGWKIVKKVAQDFKDFQYPKQQSQDKINLHPKTQQLFHQMTQPLQPLKYKLQNIPSPDTTILTPLGNTEQLPFSIKRTWPGNFPVYIDFKQNRQKVVTVIRKVQGDIDEFTGEVKKVTGNAPLATKVGRIEINGDHRESLTTWLKRLGF